MRVQCGKRGVQVAVPRDVGCCVQAWKRVITHTMGTIPPCTFHLTSTTDRAMNNGVKVQGTIAIPIDSKRDIEWHIKVVIPTHHCFST